MSKLWKRSLSLMLALVMIVGMLPVNVFAATANKPLAEADGILWLFNNDGGASKEFENLVMGLNLDNLIRKAVGADENDENIKVAYEGANIGSLGGLMAKGEELKDTVVETLKSHALISFTVGDVDKWIAVRTIQGVDITVGEDEKIVISNAGEPDDLADRINAVLADPSEYITITHNGEAELSKTRHTVSTSAVDDYSWPEAGEEAEVGKVTVTVAADDTGTEKTGTATVVLRDSRTVLTNKYDYSNGTGESVSHNYYKGETAPKAPELPEYLYYFCTEWVVSNVEGNVTTYVPDWTPNNDTNNNNVADELESFTITYKYEEGQTLATFEEVKHGSATPQPAQKPSKEGYSFGGWVDADGNPASAKVAGDATYYPNWTQNPVVTYLIFVDDVAWEPINLPTKQVNGKYYAEDISDLIGPMDGYIQIDWMAEDEFFDFDTAVVGDITLETFYYTDRNKNDVPDGTKNDPYLVYQYYVEGDLIPRMTKDGILKSDAFNPYEDVDYPASALAEKQVFKEWNLSDPEVSSDGGTQTYKCTPVLYFDVNGNGMDDAQEKDTVVLPEGFTHSFADGKIQVTNGEYVGYVEITGLMEDGGEYKFTYDSDTTITATPLWKNGEVRTEMSHYVADIQVNNDSADANYKDFNLSAQGEEVDNSVTVHIIYDEATKFVAKEGENDLLPGQSSYDVEEVYNEAISVPDYSDEITLQYLARPAGTITVSLTYLKDRLRNSDLVSMVETAEEMGMLPDVCEFTVSARYGDVSDPETYRSADEVANEYIDGILEKLLPNNEVDYDYLGTFNFKEMFDELEALLEENAELHKFGQIAIGDDGKPEELVVETLDITYETESQYAHTSVDLKIVDEREASVIKVLEPKLEYSYGGFTDKMLLDNVVLQDADGNPISGELKLDASYEIKSAGDYEVTVSFQGNQDYKPAQATFDLTITKVSPTITVDQMITVLKGQTYDPYPVIDPENARYIQVIAGVAMNELKFDESALISKNPVLKLEDDTVTVKAWVKLPELYIESLKDMGIELGSFEDIELINQALEGEQTVDDIITEIVQAALSAILNKLPPMISNRLGLEGIKINLKVRFDSVGETAHPVDPGFYLNLAANMPGLTKVAEIAETEIPENVAPLLSDPNYEPAYAMGFITITPMIPIPNRGGVQLYYDGVDDTQNVFVFENDGIARDFKVAINGEAKEGAVPMYYGLTTRLDPTTQAPSAPGLYVVGYNYTETQFNEVTGENEVRRLGSDSAVIIIKQTPTVLSVAGKTVTYDGKAHLPTITVKDKDGKELKDAAVTVISGSVSTGSEDGNIGLEDLSANVNIDFPEALDKMWVEFWRELGKNAPNTATPDDVVKFLNWCKEKTTSYSSEALALMESMGIPKGYVSEDIEEKLESGIDQTTATLQNVIDRATFYFDKLIAQVEKIASKTSDSISMSIKELDDLNYTETGYYLFAGVVTDPDYVPEVGAGLLIIKSADTYLMKDTYVPYDGETHSVDIDDQTSRDGIVMIVDDNGDYTKINFDLDTDMTKVFESVLEKAGYTLKEGSDSFVGTVYEKGEAKISSQIDSVITEFEKQAKAKVVSRVEKLWPEGGEKLEAALEKAIAELNERLPGLTSKLSAKLQELDHLENDTLVILNGKYPVEVGTYEFYGYDYDVAATSATLYIQNDIVITPVLSQNEYTIGSEDPVTLTYKVTLNGEQIDESHEVYQALNIGCTISGVEGVNTLEDALKTAGTYTIGATYTESVEYKVTVNTAKLTVVEAEVGIGDGTFDEVSMSLELEDEVHNNFFFTVNGFEGLYESIDPETGRVEDIGLLIYNTRLDNQEDCTYENADERISGGTYDYEKARYEVRSDGIAAKDMGDDVWYKLYVKTENGYVYSNRYRFSPRLYSLDVLSKPDKYPLKLRSLCVALMNYGSDAQLYFAEKNGYEYDQLMNTGFDDYQSLVTDFESTMITDRIDWNESDFNIPDDEIFEDVRYYFDLEGALTFNFKFITTKTEIDKAGVLIWTDEEYLQGKTSVEDATVFYAEPANIIDGVIDVGYPGLAAKEMGTTFFACGFVETKGDVVYSKVVRRNIDFLANTIIEGSNNVKYVNLMKAMVRYGEYAYEYFLEK